MCQLPQNILDTLDRVPIKEIEEYLDKRKNRFKFLESVEATA